MTVFVAVPVYQGSQVVAEALRAIQTQTFKDFRVLISVDDPNDPSIPICQSFTDDPRFEVVVQPKRLGWPGNFNWLAEQCDQPFFCYWQQDDLTSHDYLQVLHSELTRCSDAAIAYTDVQWFGTRHHRDTATSIKGSPLSRVLQQIESIRYEPLRGLIRASMLPPGGIPLSEDESCQEEFVFLCELAARGEFRRVQKGLYFKRAHDEQAHARWFAWPAWRRRRGWLSMGAGMYRIANRVAPPGEQPRILATVIDRLAVNRRRRGFFSGPISDEPDILCFVRDFVQLAGLDVNELIDTYEPGLFKRPIHPAVLTGLDSARRHAGIRERLAQQVLGAAHVEIDMSDNGDGNALLGPGWSMPEPWGVWSTAAEVVLRIPVRKSSWTATLGGRVFAPHGSARVRWSGNGIQPGELTGHAGARLRITVHGTSAGDEAAIKFELPDAVVPAEAGASPDRRLLGLGLSRIRFNAR